MKGNYSIMAAGLAVIGLLSGLSESNAQVIYTEGFSGSTVMSSNPAAPTATSTDYAVLSSKNATGSSVSAGSLDLTIGGTSSGLAEMEAIFTDSPVTLNEGETLRMQITFEGTYLLDGGDSYGSPGSQFIAFGMYNSGGSNPVPGGALASGDLALKEDGDYGSGYAAGWQGYVGRIANVSQGSSRIYTRDPQSDTWNESQDAVFDEGVTGGFDTPRGTVVGSGPAMNLEDGVYTMVMDITKSDLGGMEIDQYIFKGEGLTGARLYSCSGFDINFNYETFDALAFGYRGRANLSNAVIHLDISALEIGLVDLQTPSVSGLADASVLASQSLTLAPVIFGADPLSIQWSSNSVVLAGETNTTLQLNNIQLSQDGTVYSVLASNELGSASASMTLTVTTPPAPTGLYNIQLNYGDGSPGYVGAAQIGSTNDVWNNPEWVGVGTFEMTLFSQYIVDSGNANSVLATLTSSGNDGAAWNSGTFNHYSSRDDGSPNPVFMEQVIKVNDQTTLTLALSGLPTNTECTVYLYGSGNKHESGYTGSLDLANEKEGGIALATIMYDTNSTYAATGRDVTLATSQGLSWEVLTGTTDESGNLTITLAPPGEGNAGNQVFTTGMQILLDLPNQSPTEDPVLQSINVSGDVVTLSWTAEDLGTYSILRKTNLIDATWSTVVSNLPSGDLTTNVTASGAGEEFYQIMGE